MSQSSVESCLTEDIRKHYDVLSGFYQMLWGAHIHHGYWEDGESPAEAQIKLVEHLAARLEIARGHRVLDIGSGLGGSACWLAKTFGCSVLGLTLSPVQVQGAQKRAQEEGVSQLVSIREHDANKLDLPAGSFDRIWIIECSEHIHDKQAFFRDCARLLSPGGRLGLCVWLKGDARGSESEGLVREVCEAMLCPSLLTMDEQVAMLEQAGFGDIAADDITTHVQPTWEHCSKLVSNPLAKMFLFTKGSKLRRFVNSFELMEKGYREGAMAYGMITAVRR
ncbi:MAG: class I SAM-dependent methyltransferase [Phycisphaerales bacterium]